MCESWCYYFRIMRRDDEKQPFLYLKRVLKELREPRGYLVIQAEGATSICLTYSRDSEVASMVGAEREVRDEF